MVTLIFILFSVIPGDPARMVLGQRSDSVSVAAVRKDLGLDRPIFQQYLKYLNDLSPVAVFNSENKESFFTSINQYIIFHSANSFGIHQIFVVKYPYLRRSYQNQRNISGIIASALPATFILALVAIVFASFVGIGLGILSALNCNGWADRCLLFLLHLGMSLPSFFAAILIGWLFAFVLGELYGS